jgi:aspartate kinase
MEAIHPKAAKPLELAGVKFRVKNTFQPEHPGTLISKEYVSPEPKVEIVSGTNRGIAFEVRGPMMDGEVGYDPQITEIMRSHHIGYILKSVDASGITMVVHDKPEEMKMLDELRQSVYQLTISRVAIVCAMGSNIADPRFLRRATEALAEKQIDIRYIGQSHKHTNLQFVIARDRYADAVRALNDALCLRK